MDRVRGEKEMNIVNPVLRGFHPDPCFCKARGKYYIVTSTFEWVPGIMLYESEDLVNWKPRGGILKNLNLEGVPDSAGIWAPSLSFDGDFFYLVFTICRQIDGIFKDIENYVTTASELDGEWSPPVFINASGFDPSMFHENGRHYILNPQWDSRPLKGHQKFNGLILQEFDFKKEMIGKSKVIFRGSKRGGTEGPHLMKKDDNYYIIAAEGGTGRHHSIVVARSKDLWGPYEISPYDPLITSWEKDTILKKSGHGNFIETNDGEWYMAHLCARYLPKKDVSILGRETSIQKIEWKNGWPRMVQGDCVPSVLVEAPRGAKQFKQPTTYKTDFYKIDFSKEGWLSLRSKFEDKIKFLKKGMEIKGNHSLTSLFGQSLIARRWTSFDFEAMTTLEFYPYHYAQTAGLTCYYNTKVFYYLYIGYDEEKNQRIVNILINDNFHFSEPLGGKYIYLPEQGAISLKVEVHEERMQFFYSLNEKDYRKVGPALDTSILSDEHAAGWAYTGAVVGITAVDNFNKDMNAVFLQFEQRDF